MPAYYEIESKFMDIIFDKFGLKDLTEEEMAYVRQIDDEILEHELPALINGYDQLKLPVLSEQPDFSLRECVKIEEEFINLYQTIKVI